MPLLISSCPCARKRSSCYKYSFPWILSFLKEKEVQNLRSWAIPQSSNVNSRGKTEQWTGDGFPSLVKSRAPGPPLRLSNSLWCLSLRPCCCCHQVELWSILPPIINFTLFAAGKSLDSTSPELIHLLPGWLIFPPLLQVASYLLETEENSYLLPLSGSLVCNPLLGKPVNTYDHNLCQSQK